VLGASGGGTAAANVVAPDIVAPAANLLVAGSTLLPFEASHLQSRILVAVVLEEEHMLQCGPEWRCAVWPVLKPKMAILLATIVDDPRIFGFVSRSHAVWPLVACVWYKTLL